MATSKIKKGDTVRVIAGKDKDDKCLLPVPLYSSNSVEKLCDEWVLSTSV